MDIILDEPEVPIELSFKEIFLKIWASPREAFNYINDNKYDKNVQLLIILGGVASAFERVTFYSISDFLLTLTISIVIGIILGFAMTFLTAALCNWTGKWIQGKGDTNSILRILAFAMIPSILTIVFKLMEAFAYGSQELSSSGDRRIESLTSIAIIYSANFLELVLGIWALVLTIIGLSVVQKFSIGKAILNIIFPSVIILIPVMIYIMLF